MTFVRNQEILQVLDDSTKTLKRALGQVLAELQTLKIAVSNQQHDYSRQIQEERKRYDMVLKTLLVHCQSTPINLEAKPKLEPQPKHVAIHGLFDELPLEHEEGYNLEELLLEVPEQDEQDTTETEG